MLTQQIIELALKEKVSTDFSAFYKKSFETVHPTTPYRHNWHIDYLSEIALDCSQFKIPKIIINMPPGLSKSTLFSQAYVAWCLGKDPGLYNMCVSSSDSLVVEHSGKTRDIMKSDWYRAAFPHTVINKETDHLITTSQNGTRVGFSTMSRVTGKGAHNLIFDDFLDAEMAKSDIERVKAVDGIGGKFFTRLRDNTEDGQKCIMVIEQRLHDMDLTGKLLGDFSDYMHICLPAYWEGPKTISYGNFHKEVKEEDLDEDGKFYLEPIRMGKKMLADKQIELRDAFSGQYLQDPVLKGGNIVKLEWFQRYYPEHLPKFKTIIVSCDTAYKPAEINDPSCFMVFGVTDKEEYYILDMFNRKMDYPNLKRNLIFFLEKWKPNKILIEDASSGQSLIQELRNTKWVPTPIKPKDYGGDKTVRFTNSTDVIEAGKVYLPEKAPWLQEFESQVTRFPKAVHDEAVDCLSQALNWLKKRKVNIFFAEW